jgi:hypothetical protein
MGKTMFTIYQMDASDNLTRSRVDRFLDISQTLVAAGAGYNEISRLNLSTHSDIDLYEYIHSKMNGVVNSKPPYVFYYSHYLGDGETVQQMFQTGRLQQLIRGTILDLETPPSPPATPLQQPPASEPEQSANSNSTSSKTPEEILETKPQLRLIDNILEVTESLSSYFNPFSWWRNTGSILANDSAAVLVVAAEPILSVEVIHTNWYGRNLRRTFKFYDSYYHRVHPNGQVRATINYTEITAVNRKDQGILVIEYTPGISPDWIQASANDITRILALLLERKPSSPLSNNYV